MKNWLRLLIIMIPIAIGLVFLIIAQERNRQRERLLLHTMRQKADKHGAAIASVVEDVTADYRKVRAMAAQVSNAVLFVTGEALHEEKPEIEAADEPAADESEETETPPAAEPSAPPPDADDASMPPGIGMSPAELRRLHERQAKAGRGTPAEKAPAAAAAGTQAVRAGEEETSDDGPAPEPEPTGPPVVLRARDVLAARDTLRVETESLAALQERADKAMQRFTSASRSLAAVKPLEQLEGYARSAARSHEVSTNAFASAQAALGEVLSIKSAKERADREREEQERRQREEAARRAKIKEEAAIAKEIERAVSDAVLAFQFEDALTRLQNTLARLETDGARATLKNLLERYRRVASLHAFLIERINAEPFRWGWGSGTTARDITAADETKITIAGGAVRWNKIPDAQLFRIIEHYLKARTVGATRRAEQWVGAAILAREHGDTGRAAAYGAEAVELLPRLRSDLERLAPIKQ